MYPLLPLPIDKQSGAWIIILGLGQAFGVSIGILGLGTDTRELRLPGRVSPHKVFSSTAMNASPHGILYSDYGHPPRQTGDLAPTDANPAFGLAERNRGAQQVGGGLLQDFGC